MVDELILQRLRKGAEVLGRLFRMKKSCERGWSTDGNWCECEKPSDFCRAKVQWLVLAGQVREIEGGPWGLFHSMTAREWDETGLTAKLESEKLGEIAIGRNGRLKMGDLAAFQGEPETAGSILSLMKAFPGSKVEKVS